MPAKLRLHAAPATLASRAVIVAFALAGVIALNAGEALANHVSCGDTITADTTLDRDLVNCPNNGIVIGADGIALDLNRHRIDGDGSSFAGCAEDAFCDVGVLNDGHDGVTVKDGSVRQFALGLFVGQARQNRVLRISSSKNVFFGFVIVESAQSVVRDSKGNGNLTPDGDGLGLFGSHDIRVLDSSFRRNPLGIHVGDSTGNSIRRNAFSRNRLGILMEADRNGVRRNRCVRNDDACIMVGPGDRNVIARNRVSQGMGGVFIGKGRGNVVARNVIAGVRRGGVLLFGGGDSIVRRNRVRRSGGDGFVVKEEDDHSLLRRNRARRAGDDGFDVEDRSTKLTRNRARRNGDLGIEAVRGVVDGGGNIARHNGDLRQCTHVSCS